MATAVLAPSLQSSVDRFAKSLIVPSRLLKLHPRKRGGAGDHAALAPAITLGVIGAFEGFVEDFFATVLYLQGQSFAQIVKKINKNNPDLDQIRIWAVNDFPTLSKAIGDGFEVDVWKPPVIGKTFWQGEQLDWKEAAQASKAWMEVRHCLSHGLASGWRSEVWPGPVGAGKPHASEVLRPMKDGKHSLALHGAISCARIYQVGAQHVADLVADHLGQKLNWAQVPDFPLRAAPR